MDATSRNSIVHSENHCKICICCYRALLIWVVLFLKNERKKEKKKEEEEEQHAEKMKSERSVYCRTRNTISLSFRFVRNTLCFFDVFFLFFFRLGFSFCSFWLRPCSGFERSIYRSLFVESVHSMVQIFCLEMKFTRVYREKIENWKNDQLEKKRERERDGKTWSIWSGNCTLWKLESDDCIRVTVSFIDEIRALPFIWPPARATMISFEIKAMSESRTIVN